MIAFLTIPAIMILMIIDYLLTLKSIALYKKIYSKYFEVESMELNPMFQKDMEKGRYNPKHALSMIFTCTIVFLFLIYDLIKSGSNTISVSIMPPMMIISMLLYINLNHIRNIWINKIIAKNPKYLSGKIKQKHIFSLKSARIYLVPFIVMLGVLFVLEPSYVTLGFALGPIGIYLKNLRWERIYKKKKRKK